MSYMPYWRTRVSIRDITCNSNSCGSKRIIWKPRRSAAVRWGPWTSIACARSTRYRKRFGTARRRCIVSKRSRETRWKTVTWKTDIQRRTRNATWPGGRVWRSRRSATGSRTVVSETGRPNNTGLLRYVFFI